MHPAVNPADRRASPRVPLSAKVELRSHDNFYAGRTRDISMGGLFIETFVALDLGARIDVRVAILHQVFSVPTEVVWIVRDRAGRGRGLGVRFLAMPAAMRRAIAEFMRQRPPITFEVESHG